MTTTTTTAATEQDPPPMPPPTPIEFYPTVTGFVILHNGAKEFFTTWDRVSERLKVIALKAQTDWKTTIDFLS